MEIKDEVKAADSMPLILCRCIPLIILFASLQAEQSPKVIWQIGKPDNSGYEFAAGSAPAIDYIVGRSEIKNWRRSIQAAANNAPTYRIHFHLNKAPVDPLLTVDVRYVGIAPRGLEVRVNERHGYFQVRPEPAVDLDQMTSYMPLYSRQQFRIPLSLHVGENEIGISFQGDGGSAEFDALTLEGTGGGGPSITACMIPTIFFKNSPQGLTELADVVLRHREPMPTGHAVLTIGPFQVPIAFHDDGFDFGDRILEVAIPAREMPSRYVLTVNDHRFSGGFRPQTRWRLFAGLSIHNDIGFSDLQQNVQALDIRNTDKVLDALRQFPFYKFNLETGWLADNYLKTRTGPRLREFIGMAERKRLGINALYLNMLTGLCTGEELYRSLYFSSSLERRFGIPMRFASQTDTPSQTWFLPTLLRDADVKSFSLGSDQIRGPLLQNSHLNEDSPFWWEGPDGSRVLSWFARNYQGFFRLVSKNPSVDRLRRSIPQFLARYRRGNYPVDAVLIYGLFMDNTEMANSNADTIAQWNRAYAYPKIIPATDADYFNYIAPRFGKILPIYRGDAGAYWEDGAASAARETTLNRDSQMLLPIAEFAATLASTFDRDLAFPVEEFHTAWKDLLFYDEHSWGSHHSVEQPDRETVREQWDYKRAYAKRSHWAATDLLVRSLSDVVEQISLAGPTIFVFNPTVTERTDVVQIDMEPDRELIDETTGVPVPLDIVVEREGFRTIRFLARAVPGLGYKAFLVRKATPAKADVRNQSWTIESRYYRVEVDPKTGAVSHLMDKELHRDLVDTKAHYRFNQLLYVSGGERSQIVETVANLPKPELHVEGQRGGQLLECVRTPFGARIRVRSEASNVPSIETEISVYDDLKRVDIVNRLSKKEVRAKEAVYFAFPFWVISPQLLYEVQNSLVRPNLDQLPGAAREWFSTQNLVICRDSNVSIAWATPDAPMVTFTDINRGIWPKELKINNGHLFSYVMNNYWFTNYKASQAGDFRFRYALTSAARLKDTELARFGATTRSQLVPYDHYDKLHIRLEPVQRRMPAAQGAFFTIEGDAELSAFKVAEDAHGVIVRLRATGGTGTALLRSHVFHILSARMTNGVEKNGPMLSRKDEVVRIPLVAHQFSTVRLVLAPE